MSLDSLGRSVQRGPEGNQQGDNSLDNEIEPDIDINPKKEEQERIRSRAYDTISIADSTLGGCFGCQIFLVWSIYGQLLFSVTDLYDDCHK